MPKMKFDGLPSQEPEDKGPNYYDGPKPPAGVYSGPLKMVRVKDTQSGNKMLSCLVEIQYDDDDERSQYNGYGIFGNVNILDSTAWLVARFAKSIGATYADIAKGNVVVDSDKPPNVVSIGKVKMAKFPRVTVQAVDDEYPKGTWRLQINSFLAPKDEDAADDDGVEPDDDAADDAADDGEEYDEDGRREELEELERRDLAKEARALGLRVPRDADEDAIIEMIIEAETEEPDDGDDGGDEVDEEELREELAELTKSALRRRAKGLEIEGLREMDEDELIDAIVEAETNEPPF